MDWPGSSTVFAKFDITTVTQNSDTRVRFSFNFTGTLPDYNFHAAYSYFTLQTFFCNSATANRFYA